MIFISSLVPGNLTPLPHTTKPPFFLLFEAHMATMAAMILTAKEVENLVTVQHRSPHTLLGVHPLGDGSGLVVRAFLPDAAAVEIVPVHEKNRPAIKLKRLHAAGLFEGVTHDANRVYAYDLVIVDHRGNRRQTRDPYS